MPYKWMTGTEIVKAVIEDMGQEFLLHDNDRDIENGLNCLEKRGLSVVSVQYSSKYNDVEQVLFHYQEA